MGGCHAKPRTRDADSSSPPPPAPATPPPPYSTAPATPASKKHWTSSPFFPFSTPSPSPAHHLFSSSSAASPRASSKSPAPAGPRSPAPATPARRLLPLPFLPPSPAKHICQALARRHGPPRPAIPEEDGEPLSSSPTPASTPPSTADDDSSPRPRIHPSSRGSGQIRPPSFTPYSRWKP